VTWYWLYTQPVNTPPPPAPYPPLAVPCHAAASGTNVTVTCQRPGSTWPAAFNATLTAAQADGTCSSSASATAPASLAGPAQATVQPDPAQGSPTLFTCDNSVLPFRFNYSTNAVAPLSIAVVNSSTVSCTTASTALGGWVQLDCGDACLQVCCH
jgi:hypothetical protein